MGDVVALSAKPEKSWQYEKLSHQHVAMVEWLAVNPAAKQSDLARHFGLSMGRCYRVTRMPAFQEALRIRCRDMLDPEVVIGVTEKLEAVGLRALEVLAEKLDVDAEEISENLLLRALDISLRGMGLGGGVQQTNVQVNVTNHLEDLASRMVVLLEHKKREAESTVTVDALPGKVG